MERLSALKDEWHAAPYTPPEDDDELAHENDQLREVIGQAAFPPMESVCRDFLAGYWGKRDCEHLVAAMVTHRDLVYASVAKIVYAMCTDAFDDKARAIGEELHAVGGLALMQCVYYALSMVARAMTAEVSDESCLHSAFYGALSHAFHGVGDWRC